MKLKNYGLIGHPVLHSFSGNYFNTKFKSENINAEYHLIDLDNIQQFKSLFLSKKWNGFNVTIPYKKTIIEHLDELSDEAKMVGAVNTIKIEYRRIAGKITPYLIGYNTDIIGFENTLTPLLTKHHKKALILGTGGASMAVEYVVKKLGIESIKVSRTANDSNNIINYNQLTSEIIESHKLIVNTTPVGMTPHTAESPDIPYDALTSNHLLYDLIYNPEATQFLQNGKIRGCQTISGLDMLYAQADAAYEIWESIILP